MITVSSCGVKLQEVLSGFEKERLKHWKYTCTFVAFLNIHSFIHYFIFFATWDVICCSQQVLALVTILPPSTITVYQSLEQWHHADASEQQEESTFEDRIISFIHSHILTLVPLGPRQIGSLYVQWTE